MKLQNAYCTTQLDTYENKWQVLTGDGKHTLLTLLPAALGAEKAMSYLHFARPFELEAYNVGHDEGAKESALLAAKDAEIAAIQIKFLENENNRLASTLDRLLTDQEA